MTLPVAQWGRECSVQVGEMLVEHKPKEPSLRIAFQVERELGEEPPRADVAIWGLSADTRAELEQVPDLPCEIKAGYEGGSSSLFVGVLRKSESVRQGPEWIFRAQVGDVVELERDKGAKARKTFAEGTPLATVLKELVKLSGLKPGNSNLLGVPFVSDLKFQSGTDKLEKSLSVYDSALDELNVFCRSCGIVWSIQGGAFQGAIAGTFTALGPLLSPDTGLIEPSPRINDKGHVIGTALLNPSMIPGVGFVVESRKVNGQYICAQTRHIGDTHGATDWRVEWRGVPPGGFGAYLSQRYNVTSLP
jgi:hypothetical protein